MNIPMLDIQTLHAPIQSQLDNAVQQVLHQGTYINGPQVAQFEQALAAHVGAKEAIGVSSGTDALLATLMALELRPGDKVITSTYSFFATAGAIARLGATPIFVDVNFETYNLIPSQVEDAIDSHTVGIIPVHLFGCPAPMDQLLQIATKHHLWIVEDAAQALGATYHQQAVGTIATAGIYSFFPAKNLGAAGDGGAIVTNDTQLAKKIRTVCSHGASPKYYHHMVGGNFRLDTIQAAVLCIKLPHLAKWNNARLKAAQWYDRALLPLSPSVLPPASNSKNESQPSFLHAYNQYVIRIRSSRHREKIQRQLANDNIGSALYYPLPLHRQPCFSHLGYNQESLPQSEKLCASCLAIPINPTISRSQQKQVITSISKA